jgi:hypothetical protein
VTAALELLGALDRELDTPVELTLYGRAAIALGFSTPPPDAALSKDVDGVLWLGQAEELLATNFWDAVGEVNREFADRGLYISHLFCEDQVILSPDWKHRRTPIAGDWAKLRLHRLGDADLLLSKLMRNDEADQQDALFICRASALDLDALRSEIAKARVPPIPEIEAEFAMASARLLARI